MLKESAFVAIAAICLMAAPASSAFLGEAAAGGEIILENGLVRTVFTPGDISYSQIFYAWNGASWVEILDFAKAGDSLSAGRTISSVSAIQQNGEERFVDVSGSVSLNSFSMRISLKGGENFFKIEVEDLTDSGIPQPEAPMTSYLFKPEGKKYSETGPLDFTFTPLLKELPPFGIATMATPSETPTILTQCPQLDTVIGQHVFRSPAIILQEKNVLAALVPDIDDLKTNYGLEVPSDPITSYGGTRFRAPALDYDVTDILADAPILSYGWCYQGIYGLWHSFYIADHIAQAEPSKYCFFIYLDADAPEGKGFEDVVAWQWEKYGNPYFESTILPQTVSYDKYADYAFEYMDRIWEDFEINGVPCGGVPINRESTPDFWFQGWFQHVRSAYGIYIYGEKLGNSTLVEKARKILNLALQSPNDEGPFYAIYSLLDNKWSSSPTTVVMGYAEGRAGNCGGVDWGHQYYHTLDNSWTAYWMLRWYEDLEKDGRILPYVQKYADFLISHQQPSGAIPSWFEIGTLTPHEVYLESAETSASMLFLAELYKVTGEQKYIESAEKAADFMIKSVYPENKWFDYETFFSCSAKNIGYYDDYTAQHPQNTLSMYWTAAGMKALYEATGNPTYLDYGCRALDYMCLNQQIWNASFLSVNTFGGFGVMNTDAEWNDARQSKFGQILLDYYSITGNAHYFERGIAAMRSAFMTMSCPENKEVAPTIYDKYGIGQGDENYGHGGYDVESGYSPFDWGSGSAMAGAAEAWSKYGGVYVDVERGNAFGLDGCIVKNVKAESGQISFTIVPMLNEGYGLDFVVNVPNANDAKITVNGERVKDFEVLEDSRLRFTAALGGELEFEAESGKEGLGAIIPDFTACSMLAALLVGFFAFAMKKLK